MTVAEAQRLLDHPRTCAPAQLPGAQPDERNTGALRFDGGRIAEGAVADINIVDTDNSFFLSPGPFLANLVYSAHSDCIDSVICNGKFLMRHREIPDEKEILTEARKVLAKIS